MCSYISLTARLLKSKRPKALKKISWTINLLFLRLVQWWDKVDRTEKKNEDCKMSKQTKFIFFFLIIAMISKYCHDLVNYGFMIANMFIGNSLKTYRQIIRAKQCIATKYESYILEKENQIRSWENLNFFFFKFLKLMTKLIRILRQILKFANFFFLIFFAEINMKINDEICIKMKNIKMKIWRGDQTLISYW